MTEVPEYLLERSRARRAALGLPITGGPPAEGATPPPSSGEGGDATPAVASMASAPATQAATAPVVSGLPSAPVEELPAYVREPGRRTGIPAWMMPILLLLPLWGIVYMGAFGETSTASGEVSGAQVFSQRCAVCHGANGGGGVGPKLTGEVTLTFPAEADHLAFVSAGSASIKGQPYGDPARPGGQHVAKSGGMPPFANLPPEELAAVVKFEREGL